MLMPNGDTTTIDILLWINIYVMYDSGRILIRYINTTTKSHSIQILSGWIRNQYVSFKREEKLQTSSLKKLLYHLTFLTLL